MSKLTALIAVVLVTASGFSSAFAAGGTSSTINPDTYDPNSADFGNAAASPVLITFSEFPLNTTITTQYNPQGIDFSSAPVFITTDVDTPTTPVLSGTPLFSGPVTGCFVHPTTGTPGTRRQFSLSAGYFNELGSTRLSWFDRSGNLIGSVTNSSLAIQTFTVTVSQGQKGVHCWTIEITSQEAAGFAVDNVSFRGFMK